MEARFRPRIQAPHGRELFGALEYPIGWIEWPDNEYQTWKGAVCARPFSVQSPIDVDQTNNSLGPDSGSGQRVLGGKRLKFN